MAKRIIFNNDQGFSIPNTSGNLRTNRLNAVYGEIYVNAASAAHSVATNTWHQVEVFDTNGVSQHCSPDNTENHILIDKEGVYKVSICIAFSGTGSVDWQISGFKNNGATQLLNVHANRKLGAAGDVGAASCDGLVQCEIGDTIEVWVKHLAGVNKDITVQDCNLNVIKIN